LVLKMSLLSYYIHWGL